MIASFVAYIGSFLIFGLARPIWTLLCLVLWYENLQTLRPLGAS